VSTGETAIQEAEKAPARRPFWERLRGNPVLVKELRARMRGRRAFVVLTVYLGFLSLVVMGTYLAFLSSSSLGVLTAGSRQLVGKVIFGLVTGLELATISFVAPALASGAISSEREHQTYDLLRVTLLPARELVLGKFAAALVFCLLLLVSALPLQSLAYLFGGVSFVEIALGALLLLVTTIAFCAFGVFFSSFVKRTLAATVISYSFAILVMFGAPLLLLGSVYGYNSVQNALRGGLALNPTMITTLVYGAWAVISLNPISAAIATEVLLLEEQTAFLYYGNIGFNQNVWLVSPWIPYSLVYLLASAGLIYWSIRNVRKPEQ
jgi:ABC-type transport system involved in multi-copper enzyme maturation permease subunit